MNDTIYQWQYFTNIFWYLNEQHNNMFKNIVDKYHNKCKFYLKIEKI